MPDEASLTVDLRARERSAQSAARLEIETIAASSTVPDVSSSLEVLAHHPPMERSEGSRHLLAMAKTVAAGLGIELREAASGGASDANTTAALGVPTLDGLGPVGGNAHSADEYLELDSVVPRATLLAGLLVAIGRDAGLRARPLTRPATTRPSRRSISTRATWLRASWLRAARPSGRTPHR